MNRIPIKTVYKYPVPLDFVARQEIFLPEGAKPLVMGFDGNLKVCLWAEVNPDAPSHLRKIAIIGTGEEVPENLKYLNTFERNGFVFHSYVEEKN